MGLALNRGILEEATTWLPTLKLEALYRRIYKVGGVGYERL
jgi:hypothetical protein